MPVTPKNIKAAAFAAIAATTGLAAAATAPAMAGHHKSAQQQQSNIVETAMSTGVHETLVTAVKAAGLVDTLSSPGPFTVFAPTAREARKQGHADQYPHLSRGRG